MYCRTCGKEVLDEAVVCIHCGCMLNTNTNTNTEQNKKTNVATVLGILGIVFAWLFALIGHILSITGIIIGIKEYRKTGKTTGLVLSIVGEIFSLFSSFLGIIFALGIF